MVLKLNSFTFKGQHYLQIKGVAMGSKLGPGFACVYVGYFEEILSQSYNAPRPRLNKRYIDDIVGVMIGTHDDLNTFLQFVSSFSSSLKFTWSISDSSVNFLDLTISVNAGRLATSIFYKETDSHTYLLYSSSHPSKCKDSIPYAQLNAYVAYAVMIVTLKIRLLRWDHSSRTVFTQTKLLIRQNNGSVPWIEMRPFRRYIMTHLKIRGQND